MLSKVKTHLVALTPASLLAAIINALCALVIVQVGYLYWPATDDLDIARVLGEALFGAFMPLVWSVLWWMGVVCLVVLAILLVPVLLSFFALLPILLIAALGWMVQFLPQPFAGGVFAAGIVAVGYVWYSFAVGTGAGAQGSRPHPHVL